MLRLALRAAPRSAARTARCTRTLATVITQAPRAAPRLPEVSIDKLPPALRASYEAALAAHEAGTEAPENEPLPPVTALRLTYHATLAALAAAPEAAAYRQSAQATTHRKLDALSSVGEDVGAAEAALRDIGEIGLGGLSTEEGIEGALDIAVDELELAKQMVEWEAWSQLAEPPTPGQWEYVKA